jgi:branched-chain amino acid transport system permease protein
VPVAVLPSSVAWVAVTVLVALALRAEHRSELLAVACGMFLAGLGIVVATGWARQANLGQLGFVGIGAYVAAWMDGWPWALKLLGGAVGAAVAAVPVGLAAARLRGMALGALTLLAGVTVWSLGRTQDVMTFVDGSTSTGVLLRKPPWAATDQRFALVALAIALVALALVLGFRRSRAGRAMIALAVAPRALVAEGWEPRRLVLLAFMVSAGLGGLAGVVLGTAYGSLSAADVEPFRSLLVFAQIAVLGAAFTAAPAVTAGVLALFTMWNLPGGWLGIVSGLGLVLAGATVPDGYLAPPRRRRPVPASAPTSAPVSGLGSAGYGAASPETSGAGP